MALRAALRAALQPLEHAQPRRDRERAAQRAQVAAERPLEEQPEPEQTERVDHVGPFAVELEHDRRLERLDLGPGLGQRHAAQREREQRDEDHVLDGPQSLVHGEGDLELGYAQRLGGATGQLLESAERAQPAAEHAAPPEQERHRDVAPQDEQQRLEQEEVPAELGAQRLGEREHVEHRKLGACVPAQPQQRKSEKADAQPLVEAPAAGDEVLDDEHRGERHQGDSEHGDVEAPVFPTLEPKRLA